MPTVIDYKPLDRHEGYRVGTDGSLWSCWKRKRLGYGKGVEMVLTDVWHLRAVSPDGNGYTKVNLRGQVTIKIATAVLTTFIGPRPNGMEACHVSGVKSNNWLDNLYWGTKQQNMADRKRHGGERPFAKGHDNPASVLTEPQVVEIRTRRAAGETPAALSRIFGVSSRAIRNIVNRLSWRHVP